MSFVHQILEPMKSATVIFLWAGFLFVSLPAFGQVEEGSAVYYADDLHGQTTSYGDVYSMNEFTAAHKAYAPGTILQVTRLDNGQSVNVRVNDKIKPNSDNVVILSRAAAREIGLVRAGRARVRVTRVGFINPTLASGNQAGQLTARSPYSEYSYDQYRSPSPAPSAYDFVPRGATPTISPATSPTIDERLLPPTAFGYAIQLASFKDRDNANAHMRKLLDRGVPHVYIWQADNRKRVVVASFPDKESAERYYRSLRGEFGLEGIIVKISG